MRHADGGRLRQADEGANREPQKVLNFGHDLLQGRTAMSHLIADNTEDLLFQDTWDLEVQTPRAVDACVHADRLDTLGRASSILLDERDEVSRDEVFNIVRIETAAPRQPHELEALSPAHIQEHLLVLPLHLDDASAEGGELVIAALREHDGEGCAGHDLNCCGAY